MIAFILRHPRAFTLALILHLLILLGFAYQENTSVDNVMQVSLMDPSPEQKSPTAVTHMKPMKTTLVDAKSVQEALNKVKEEDEQKKRQQEALVAQSAAEKRKIADLQKQKALEKQKAEQAQLNAQAEQRKADESKRLALIEQQKMEAEKQRAILENQKAEKAKQDALVAEQKRLEAKKLVEQAEAQKQVLQAQIQQHTEEKKRLEEETLKARMQKEQEEQEAQIQQQLADEDSQRREKAKAKELADMKNVYISNIASSVKSNWRTAAKVSDQAQCTISITQTPAGMVSSVKVDQCKFANAQFKKDAESAVLRSQPLPPPPVKELFERNIQFIFKP